MKMRLMETNTTHIHTAYTLKDLINWIKTRGFDINNGKWILTKKVRNRYGKLEWQGMDLNKLRKGV